MFVKKTRIQILVGVFEFTFGYSNPHDTLRSYSSI